MRAAAPLAALALGLTAIRAFGEPAAVINLPGGSAQLRAGDELITAFPGSRGFAIPPDTPIVVVSGGLWAQLRGAIIRAAPGAGFVFRALHDRARLEVTAGELEVLQPDDSYVRLFAGSAYDMPLPEAALPPPGAPAPAGAPVAGPTAPSVPEHRDPFDALARSLRVVAGLEKRDRVLVEIHPFYSLSQTYQSNINRVRRDRPDGGRFGGGVLSSWITSHQAGAGFAVPVSRRHRVDGRYAAEWLNYSTQPRSHNTFNQNVGLGYAYSGIRGVTGQAAASYTNTVDPPLSELIQRERRHQTSASTSLASTRSRWFAWTLDVQGSLHRHLNPSLAASLNHLEYSAGGSTGVLLQPKTRLYLAYHQSRAEYPRRPTSDSVSHSFDAGIDGRLAPKVTGRAQLGVQRREYSAPLAGNADNPSFFQTQVALAFKPDDRNRASLQVSRGASDTVFGSNRYSIATSASLALFHATQGGLSCSANATYQVTEYPVPASSGGALRARRDRTYGAGLGLDKRVRPWLSWGLGYQRLENRSAFGDFDYADDRTTMNLRIAF